MLGPVFERRCFSLSPPLDKAAVPTRLLVLDLICGAPHPIFFEEMKS